MIDTPRSTKHTEHIPAWLLDALLGIAVTLVIALVISADQGGRVRPDAVAYGCAVGFGALMLLRRRFPVMVLMLTVVLLFAYYILGYPAIGLAVPVVAALYSAAERGRGAAAIIVSIILILVSTYFRIRDGESLAYLLGYELASTLTLMAAAIALGDSTRSRQALRAEQAQTARLIAQEHAYRAEQRVQAERVRMARDLHDLLGHSIAIISLQADVAREVIGSNDEEVRQALAHIRTISSQTMDELRSTVKLLRTGADSQPDLSLTSLTNLAPLIDNATRAGIRTQVEITGELAHVPPMVDTAAYRIIQESLTNVLRHTQASAVVLSIVVEAHTLWLRIVDNGSVGSAAETCGTGIAGMQERARLLGGTLTAHPCPTSGFEVVAALPFTEAS